jgi:SSS family solute:Na+ symporter
MVANASDGLYQLLQQLNGIFFIPVASIMLAGFFLPNISAIGAKAALFTGLSFYVICIFILEVDLHFIHIWGIEFVLNITIMYCVSFLYPNQKKLNISNTNLLDLTEWKHTKRLSLSLFITTFLIYILLGQVG